MLRWERLIKMSPDPKEVWNTFGPTHVRWGLLPHTKNTASESESWHTIVSGNWQQLCVTILYTVWNNNTSIKHSI